MSSYSLLSAPHISLSVSLIVTLTLLHLYCLYCVKQYVNQLNIIYLCLNCYVKCTKYKHNDKKCEKISIFHSFSAFCV